ncbi:unnamed protein product, partial [Amoebophrya sp. A25]
DFPRAGKRTATSSTTRNDAASTSSSRLQDMKHRESQVETATTMTPMHEKQHLQGGAPPAEKGNSATGESSSVSHIESPANSSTNGSRSGATPSRCVDTTSSAGQRIP